MNLKYEHILTKEFLIEEYINKKKSSLTIAKELKCSKIPILRRLKRYNIKIRDVKELNRQRNVSGKDHPSYIDGRTLKKYYCIEPDCGKEISMVSGFNGNGRCHSCHAKNRIGEKAPNWQGGIDNLPYSFNFNDELKESIRKRDNYICQCCNMTEEEHIIVYGQVLNIHHIDYDKMNCNENNLITVCKACNTRANFNRDYWKEFYQKHDSHGIFELLGNEYLTDEGIGI